MLQRQQCRTILSQFSRRYLPIRVVDVLLTRTDHNQVVHLLHYLLILYKKSPVCGEKTRQNNKKDNKRGFIQFEGVGRISALILNIY
jgi:hypothetical protein